MTNVQLGNLGDRRDRDHIVEGQAVSGVWLDPVLDRESGAVAETLELGAPLFAVEMGIAARVQLDDRRPETEGGLDLALARLDEQADADARRSEF